MSPTIMCLVVHYRARGWRWPFREDDEIEVWDQGSHLLGVIPGPLVRAVLLHHLQAHRLLRALETAVPPAPPPVVRPTPPLALPAPTPPRDPPRLRGVNGRRLRRG